MGGLLNNNRYLLPIIDRRTIFDKIHSTDIFNSMDFSHLQRTELSHCNLSLFGIGLFLTRTYTVSGMLYETVCCSLYLFCVPDKENYDGK